MEFKRWGMIRVFVPARIPMHAGILGAHEQELLALLFAHPVWV
jgi:hypothetical protein